MVGVDGEREKCVEDVFFLGEEKKKEKKPKFFV